MDIEWLREGMTIVKEGVVSLNNVGIRFHVFYIAFENCQNAKTLK
jgi:hypothetical protein